LAALFHNFSAVHKEERRLETLKARKLQESVLGGLFACLRCFEYFQGLEQKHCSGIFFVEADYSHVSDMPVEDDSFPLQDLQV
jgi:hypothetical protein